MIKLSHWSTYLNQVEVQPEQRKVGSDYWISLQREPRNSLLFTFRRIFTNLTVYVLF